MAQLESSHHSSSAVREPGLAGTSITCPSMEMMEITTGYGASEVTPENIAEVFARLSTQTRRKVYAETPDALRVEPGTLGLRSAQPSRTSGSIAEARMEEG